MGASGSGSLVFWIGGIAVLGALGAGVAWYAGRAPQPQEVATVPDSSAGVTQAADGSPAVQSDGSGGTGNSASESAPDQVVKEVPEADGVAENVDTVSDTETTVATSDDDGVAPEAAPPLPRLHELRLESDGLAVIAGQVAPQAEVVLRLDGEEIARTSADGSGAFATVATLSPGDGPRVLTMAQLDDRGAETVSPDELILAPVRRPAPVPEPEPVPLEPVVADAAPAGIVPQAETGGDTTPAGAGIADDAGPAGEAVDVPDAVIATDTQQESGQDEVAELTLPEPREPSGGTVSQPVGDVAAPRDTGSDEAPASSRPEPAAIDAPDPAAQTDPEPDEASPEPIPETAQDVEVAVLSDPAENAAEAATAERPDAAVSEIEATTAPEETQDHGVSDDDATAEVTEPAPPEAEAIPPAQPQATSPAVDAPPVEPALADAPAPRPTPARPGVPEPGNAQQVAILRSNEAGVSVLRPADPRPQAMSQVALDSISYSDAGDVELQGRAQERASEVRVYLDNRPIAALDVDASGSWRGALPQVGTGVYTLRIDEIDAEGRVTSRVETPFKREAPEVLAAARANATARISAVTVQKGDTLWAISRDRYGEGILYVRVFEANRDSIRDPDLIYPGQIFSLPAE